MVQHFQVQKFTRKDQISSLKSPYSTTIDPLTLFLRLLVIERKLENEITNYVNYELTPYPMSLFKDGKICPTWRSELKSHLLK